MYGRDRRWRSVMRSSCHVTAGDVVGWRSIVLENDDLQVVVLPDKGAEIHQIVDLRSVQPWTSYPSARACGPPPSRVFL